MFLYAIPMIFIYSPIANISKAFYSPETGIIYDQQGTLTVPRLY